MTPADFPFVSWRGTLMTRETYEAIRLLSPEHREELLSRFAEIELGELRRLDEDYPEPDA